MFPFAIPMAKITFNYNGRGKIAEGKAGEPLLKIALDHAVPMEHACGGNGFCTTCMCHVCGGMENLTPRNEREENMGITKDPYRLGCQARVHGEGDITVEINE